MSKIALKTSFIIYILKWKSIFHFESVNIFLVQSLEYKVVDAVVCALIQFKNVLSISLSKGKNIIAHYFVIINIFFRVVIQH